MATTQTAEPVSFTTNAVEGLSTGIGGIVVAREAASTLADPTISGNFPFNSEMNIGISAGFTLTVAAEMVANRLRNNGHERMGNLVDRGRNVITWAGSAACQLAFATGDAAGTGDTKLGIAAGFASTAFGIAIGNRFNRNN